MELLNDSLSILFSSTSFGSAAAAAAAASFLF